MNRNRADLLLILLLLSSLGTHTDLLAQKTYSLEERAALFYENQEYKYAARLYDSLRWLNADNVFYLERAALSHKRSGAIQVSIQLYKKALNNDPGNLNFNYQLGDLYDLGGKTDSAIYFFSQALNLNPENIEILNRISILYIDSEKIDSAYFFSRKALEIAPGNPSAAYTRAMIYLKDSRYADAVDMARTGLERDSSYYLLYLPLGLAYFYRTNFSKASEAFRAGYLNHQDKSLFDDYLIGSILFQNTPEGVYSRIDESSILFTRDFLNSESNASEKAQTKEQYASLHTLFKKDPYRLGIHDFYKIYLSFVESENYTARLTQDEELDELWQNNLDELYINLAEEILEKIPVHFPLYERLSQIYSQRGDYTRAFEYLYKYHGFSRAILASGNGLSPETAFRLCYFEHKNEILSQLEYSIIGENITEREGKFYSEAEVLDAGNLLELYFDISLPVKRLGIEDRLLKQIK